jgi:hypothetical protein
MSVSFGSAMPGTVTIAARRLPLAPAPAGTRTVEPSAAWLAPPHVDRPRSRQPSMLPMHSRTTLGTGHGRRVGPAPIRGAGEPSTRPPKHQMGGPAESPRPLSPAAEARTADFRPSSPSGHSPRAAAPGRLKHLGHSAATAPREWEIESVGGVMNNAGVLKTHPAQPVRWFNR